MWKIFIEGYFENKYLLIKAHKEIVFSKIKELCVFICYVLLIENN